MHARALHVATVFSRRLAPRAASSASRVSARAPLLSSKSFRASAKTMAGASPDADLCGEVFFLDEFAMRQWDDPKYGGTQIKGFDKAEFVRRVHEAHANGAGLVDGYAPFCKHVFVPNFIPGTKVGSVPITPENEPHLRSGYSAPGRRARGADPVVPCGQGGDSRGEVPRRDSSRGASRSAAMEASRSAPPLPAPWGIIPSAAGELRVPGRPSRYAQHDDLRAGRGWPSTARRTRRASGTTPRTRPSSRRTRRTGSNQGEGKEVLERVPRRLLRATRTTLSPIISTVLVCTTRVISSSATH